MIHFNHMFVLRLGISILMVFIGGLLVTGGVSVTQPNLKLELSQIDAFAWALLGLLAIHRYKTGEWLPKRLNMVFEGTAASLAKKPAYTLCIASGVYIILHVWLLNWRYLSLHTSAFDFGFVDQSLWSTTRYGFLHSSLSKGQTYLGEHFSPILALASYVYSVTESVIGVFFLQSVLLASGSVFAYWLARIKKVQAQTAIVIALCVLLFQPLRLANIFDFREDAFFIPIFFLVLIALELRKFKALWALVGLSFLIKENAPIFTALLGISMIFTSKKWRGKKRAGLKHGIGLVVTSILALYIINTQITPLFAGGASQTMLSKRIGPSGIFSFEFLKPIFQLKTLKYILNVVLPFGAYIGAAPWVALVAAVGIALNILFNPITIGFHYECVLVPFLFYILIAGASKRAPQIVLLLISFLLFFGRSPLEAIRRYRPTERQLLVSQKLSEIDESVSIAATPPIQAHLTHRRDAFLFSNGKTTTADLIIADTSGELDGYATPNLTTELKNLVESGYSKTYDQNSLVIFQKNK